MIVAALVVAAIDPALFWLVLVGGAVGAGVGYRVEVRRRHRGPGSTIN